MESQYVNIKEFCRIVGCNPRTVKAAIRRGEIPAIKFGRVYRIPLAFLQAQSEQSKAA